MTNPFYDLFYKLSSKFSDRIQLINLILVNLSLWIKNWTNLSFSYGKSNCFLLFNIKSFDSKHKKQLEQLELISISI